jgi:ribosomal-protein-alanine N-acetyltransferase
MPFAIDYMSMADVPEVQAIERDSFLTPWPISAYRRELGENKNAHYIVSRIVPPDGVIVRPAVRPPTQERRGFLSSLLPLPRLREHAHAPLEPTLGGYAGLWLVIDEAHITTIAIRPQFRGRGLGEMLLVALTEIAMDVHARWLTLEVRVSNTVAQSLYKKYGFKAAGIRKRYYSDNQEDAMIMWTDDVTTPAFQELFNELREKLRRRLITSGDLAGDGTGLSAPLRAR